MDPERLSPIGGWAAIARVAGVAACALLAGILFTPLPNAVGVWMSRTDPVGPAQAIVVLGAGIRPDGTLGNPSLRRTLMGLRLFRQGLASVLVFSGPALPHGPSEAEVRAAFARECGVAPASILTEPRGRTTREEAERIAELLLPRGIRKILLVVDPEGVPRAGGVFRKAGFDALAVPADDISRFGGGPEEGLGEARRVAMELLALAYYRVAGYL